jgi:fucose 4-O-acetylase-like acetyltransferase
MISAASVFISRIPRLTRLEIDWLKGILILLVVADHSDYIHGAFSDLFRPLTVHVIGFFLLNFYGSFFSSTPIIRFLKERFVRYLWPFFLFFSFYVFGSVLVISIQEDSFLNYIKGLVIGSFLATKAAGGGAFMWFLPALFGFSLVSRLSGGLKPFNLWVFVGSCVIFHALAAGLNNSWRGGVPFGLLIVFFIVPIVAGFFLLLGCRWFQRLLNNIWLIVFLGLLSALAYVQLVLRNEYIEIGLLVGPTYKDPEALILNFVHLIGALTVLWVTASKFAFKSFVIKNIGKHSMVIYLIHPFVFKLLNLIFGFVSQYIPFVIFSSLSFVLTVSVSVCFSIFINRNVRLKSLIFPKDFNDLFKFKLIRFN